MTSTHPAEPVPTDPAPATPAQLAGTRLAPGGRFAEWAPQPVGWVCLDVDGTLIGEANHVAPEVVRAVHRVVDAGIAVGYATGRNTDGVREVHAQLGLEGPHVVLNGAQVRRGGRALHTWAMSSAQLDGVLDLCRQRDLYAELYLDDAFVVTEVDERYRLHWDAVIGQPRGSIASHPPGEGEVIKATIVVLAPQDPAPIIAAVRGLGLSVGPATSPATPGMTFLNITPEGVDKGQAIRAGAQALGLTAAQVAVVGDGGNDLPMLEVAGTAIAMGDAAPEVRAAAHLVTAGVEADGAALALADLLRRQLG